MCIRFWEGPGALSRLRLRLHRLWGTFCRLANDDQNLAAEARRQSSEADHSLYDCSHLYPFIASRKIKHGHNLLLFVSLGKKNVRGLRYRSQTIRKCAAILILIFIFVCLFIIIIYFFFSSSSSSFFSIPTVPWGLLLPTPIFPHSRRSLYAACLFFFYSHYI